MQLLNMLPIAIGVERNFWHRSNGLNTIICVAALQNGMMLSRAIWDKNTHTLNGKLEMAKNMEEYLRELIKSHFFLKTN